MTDEIDALAADAVDPAPAVESAATPVRDVPAVTVQALRVPVGLMLDTIPNAMALQFCDQRFALTPEEKTAGVDAWCLLLEVLFPDAEKLAKLFAILGAGLWTFNVAAIRIMMARARKRRPPAPAEESRPKEPDLEETPPPGPGADPIEGAGSEEDSR